MTIPSEPRVLKTQKRTVNLRVWAVVIADALWVLWIGGYSFYLAIVVPLGGKAVGPGTQGEVTAEVTQVINFMGIALAAAWLLTIRHQSQFRLYRIFCAVTLIAVSCWLAYQRLSVIERMNGESTGVFADWSFYANHRLYIWLSLLQWLAGVGLHVSSKIAAVTATDD